MPYLSEPASPVTRAEREPQLQCEGPHPPGSAKKPHRRCKGSPGHWALFEALERTPRSSSRVTTPNTKKSHQDGQSLRLHISASQTVVFSFASQSRVPLNNHLLRKPVDKPSIQELCGIHSTSVDRGEAPNSCGLV